LADLVQALHFLHGKPHLTDARKLSRFASCQSDEGKAQFLARALAGTVFGYSTSTGESALRKFLAKRERLQEAPSA